MKTARFRNGDEMPLLGLGTWKSSPGEVFEAVKTAVELGYRHLDCAFIYANEEEVGRALSELFEAGVVARDDLWITSKLWNDSHGPDDVQPALEKTLADLQLDALDLYLMHWPVAQQKGVMVPRRPDQQVSLEEVPLAATWAAMEACVEAGLCRHIGVSNFSATKLGALAENARIAPEVNQVELHPYLQQTALLDFCAGHDVHLTAYSPLGSRDRPPALKAKDEPILLDDPGIAAIAQRSGVTSAQVLLAWSLHRGTSVIPKSVNPGRMKQNLEAAEIALSDDDMAEIAALDRHSRYVTGAFWAIPGGPYANGNVWDE